jgi:hypothetical protein
MEDVKEHGPSAHGVIVLRYDTDRHAHFEISGFGVDGEGYGDVFTICGLLDWLKAALLSD